MALSVKEIFANKPTVVLKHSNYSPDLTPRDLFLFPAVTDHLKGSHFEAVDKIQKVTADVLRMADRRIPKNILKYSPIRM
jgi:hypothetical protein